ncbi:MAG TPA: thioredoxin domain-containing protein [Candidatus Binataceae bacterium]|nr:thioredoxin domain-containing protein [Candidatus Binataceae bacterium]
MDYLYRDVFGLRPLTVFLAIASCVLALCAPSWAASSSPTPSTSAAQSVATNPARDAALTDFLQKKFRIGSASEIVLGPMQKTAWSGIFVRPVTVSNEKGQSVTVSLFSDQNETKAIIGQYLDLGSDAWGRSDISALHLEDRPTLGPPDAPITIIEFADFECPFCAHAFGEIETLTNTTYKGKIRLIFKAYPLNGHVWARTAAIGAECARLQNPNSFWDLARYFYSNQGQINPGNILQKIDAEVAKLGLDDKALKACMEAPAAAERVTQDEMDGNAVHVSSTPTFFVNGIPLVGLPEGKVFDFVINSELAAGSAHAAH